MPVGSTSELNRYKRYYQSVGDIFGQPKSRAYTTAIFSFLAVSLFGWYAIRPTLQTILFLRREIEDNKVVSQRMEEKIGKLIEAQSAYQRIQKNLPILAQALPDNPDAVGVVTQLRNLGTTAGASISAIALTNVPLVSSTASAEKIKTPPRATPKLLVLSGKKVVDVPISVVASGTYGSIQTFLEGIIRMRRILSIESVSIVPDTAAAQAGGFTSDIILRVVLKLTTHYLE